MQSQLSQTILKEEIRLLKEENAFLREENRQLKESLLPPNWVPPLEFGLTPAEKIVLATLYKRKDGASKQHLLDAVIHGKSVDKIPEIKIVDVFVCKVRKKLETFNIRIDTIWGYGYILSDEGRHILDNWDKDVTEIAA